MNREKFVRLFSLRDNLWNMALSKLKTRYSHAALGLLWAVIDPLLVLAAVNFVFTRIMEIAIPRFALFALCGIFPWTFLSNALFEATTSLIDQRGVLHQFNIPREFVPLGVVLSNFLSFLLGACFLLPVFAFFDPKVLLCIPALFAVGVLTLLFTSGLGLMLSVLNVFFRDVAHFLRVCFMFWFWMTPIFYSPEMVPKGFAWIIRLNPAASFVIFYRELLLGAKFPSGDIIGAVCGWTFLSIVTGFWVFDKCEAGLLKRL